MIDLLHELDERFLEFAAKHMVRYSREQVLRVEEGVQSVKDDVTVGVRVADPLGRAGAEAQGRVHRHRDPDQLGAPDPGLVPGLYREVERVGRVSRSVEARLWPGNAEGLMAQLVAG